MVVPSLMKIFRAIIVADISCSLIFGPVTSMAFPFMSARKMVLARLKINITLMEKGGTNKKGRSTQRYHLL
jgi:hypothetical protein